MSIARVLAIHPGADIYDSYRLRDALTPARLTSRAGRRLAALDVLRIAGLRAERLRLALSTLGKTVTNSAKSAIKEV